MPSTRERVLALVKQSPHLNQSEIAERLNVSRQRVAQIISSEHLTVMKGKRGAKGRAKAQAVQEGESVTAIAGVPAYLATAGGLAAVLIAAADLLTRGYAVYLPVSPTAAADLVAIDAQGLVKRLAVQRAKRRGPRIEYEYPKPGGVDGRALLLTDEPVRYEPEMPIGD